MISSGTEKLVAPAMVYSGCGNANLLTAALALVKNAFALVSSVTAVTVTG